MTCPTCGRPVPSGWARCPACGTMLNFTVPAPAHSGLLPYVPVRSVRGWAWVTIALVAISALAALAFVAVLIVPGWLDTLFRSADDELGTLLALVLPVVALTLAATGSAIIWLWRCRKNVDAFQGAAPRYGSGWSIGAWFIPIANLIMVPLVIADVARNSARTRAVATWMVAATWVWGVTEFISTCSDAVARATRAGGGLPLPGINIPSVDSAATTAAAVGSVTIPLFLLILGAAAQITFILMITNEQHARISAAQPAQAARA